MRLVVLGLCLVSGVVLVGLVVNEVSTRAMQELRDPPTTIENLENLCARLTGTANLYNNRLFRVSCG